MSLIEFLCMFIVSKRNEANGCVPFEILLCIYAYIYICKYVCTLCNQVLQLLKLDGCTFHTYCLAVALTIVPFACYDGNGRLSLDGYFVHQQSVIQHL